jgi:lambda family phage portal protein
VSVLQTIKNWTKRKPVNGNGAFRGWDGLTDTRLNRVQFESATGNSINADLIAYGATLRKRCAFIARQPAVEDVIQTHISDCIGEKGPTLQCVTKDKAYKKKFEAAFWDWWMNCDINGQLPGPDMMQQWWWSLWTNGAFLFQFANRADADGVTLAINNIAPDRLETPYNKATDYYTVLGVKRNQYGKPLAYYIRKPETATGYVPMEYDEIPATSIVHFFNVREVGQAGGIPWLATVLGPTADLKQFDGYVLEAAKMAAMLGVLLKATDPGTEPIKLSSGTMTDIEPGMIAAIPPGFDPMQISPQQPAPGYLEYRHDLQRDLGRPVGMPLMKVNHDASKHNYSSARFDDQQYNRRNGTFFGSFSRRVLTPMAMQWMREAVLAEVIGPAPDDFYIDWVWPKAPHVDPKKEAEGQQVRLDSKLSSYTKECAANGDDFSEVAAQLGNDLQILKDAGIELVPAKKEPPNANSEDGKDEDIGKSASGE